MKSLRITKSKSRRIAVRSPNVPRPIRGSVNFRTQETRQYYNCLTSPFDEKSYGCRVPDQYAVDTQTFAIHRNIAVSSDASGNADLVINPCLSMHAFSSRGSVIPGTSWASMDASSAGTWQGLTPAALAAKLVNYRIVGMGIRVFSTASMTNAQGRVLIATIPVENWVNNSDSSMNAYANPTDAAKTKQTMYADWGIASTAGVVDVGATDQYTNHRAYSMFELGENTVEIEPKIISPAAFLFKKSGATSASPSAIVVSQTAALGVNLTGNVDQLRVDGHETTVLTVSGAPVSTAVLDVELIFHLEGQIPPSTTASNTTTTGIVSSVQTAQAIDPIGFLEAIAAAALNPNIKTVSTAAVKGYGELSKFLRA